MQDFNLDYVAKKSVKGIFALVSRTFLIQIVGIASSFILTVFLTPSDFGVFFIVSSLIVFLNYFQDIGLAASLIQKKDQPTRGELNTIFTLQQILVFLLVVPMFLLSGYIGSFYKLSPEAMFLYYALLVSFVLSSFRTIPTILLERELNFNKLVIPQIIENLIYNVVLITFSVLGFGVTTFTIAVIARSVVGFVVTYLVKPWRPGFGFDFASIKSLMSFGLPFQLNSVLALIKDDLLTVYIGKVLPLAQVGYIGFAQKWAFMPLRLVMDNVIKITFPSYSRLQHDKDALRTAIEKSLFLVSLIIFPAIIFMIFLAEPFITFVPKYQKWLPAVYSLMFFSFNTLFSSISTPLTNFLNAIGKVKITLYFMVFWTVATWVSTIYLISTMGYNGVAFASFLVSISSVLIIIIARRYCVFSVFKSIVKQFIASIVMGVALFLTLPLVTNLIWLFVEVIFATTFYIFVLYLIAGRDLKKTFKFVYTAIRSKE